jgi:hypothetical protein
MMRWNQWYDRLPILISPSVLVLTCLVNPALQYSTVDPSLPTFNALRVDNSDESQDRYVYNGDSNEFVLVKSKKEENEETWLQSAKARVMAMISASGDQAKMVLKQESASKAKSKTHFLPDERTSMVTDDEIHQILRRSFEYIVALVEFNLVITRFQITHFLFQGFKTELGKTFKNKLMNEANWDELIEPDPTLTYRLDVVKNRISAVESSLFEVERLQRKL